MKSKTGACVIVGILSIFMIFSCSQTPVGTDFDETELSQALRGGKGGTGGNGGGKGGGGGGGQNTGGRGGLYGDLVICLRSADGIPIYKLIDGEHGLTAYPQPLKIDISSYEPLKIDDEYQTFELNDEGEVIPEDGYMVMEVDFGRTNEIRSPQSVLDKALEELILELTAPGISSITTDASGRIVAIYGEEDWYVNYDADPTNDESNDKTIDRPGANFAAYQELMSNGFSGGLGTLLLSHGFGSDDLMRLAYGTLAGGSDKFGTIDVDEVAYLNNLILKWDGSALVEVDPGSPDAKKRRYYDYSGFSYSRDDVYRDRYVRITWLDGGGTWHYTYESLLSMVPWTNDKLLVDYASKANTGITGFANAANDAVQALEFIHENPLVVYSPYFTKDGFPEETLTVSTANVDTNKGRRK